MKISIALATYNGSKYIQEQLISLYEQTLPASEVIIFDDCSSDNTIDITEQFIQERKLYDWKLTKNNLNIGFIKNFYQAITSCSGDIIFLCDQDDIWEKEKIEEMVKILRENPQVKVLNSSVKVIDENNNDLYLRNKHGYSNANMLKDILKENDLKEYTFEHLALRNISPGCTICLRKEILELFSKNPTNKIPHDWFINILGSLENGTFFYNKIFTKYRIHSNNTIGIKKESSKLKIETTKLIKKQTALRFFNRTKELKQILEKEKKEKELKFLNRYLTFLKKRLLFTESFSLKHFFPLIKYTRMYLNVYDKKMLLSDFLYSIKLNNFLQ